MLRTVLVAGLLSLAAPRPAAVAPGYEIYAIEYGRLTGFPANGLVLGADSTRKLELSLMVWLLRGEGRVILVDAGFYRQQFLDSWAVKDFVKPSDAVAKLGVSPESVTDIVVSHMHWDHADGADLFPNARVWVQEAELTHYRDPAQQRRTGVFPVDVAMFDSIDRAGRLRTVPGDSQEVAPGIRVYIGGRHTRESQYVSAPTTAGATVVLASDNAYLYENLEGGRPIAATWDTVSNRAAHQRMIRLAGGIGRVVPGHDPAVFSRFKQVAPGIAKIE